jgi:hypothetical protein
MSASRRRQKYLCVVRDRVNIVYGLHYASIRAFVSHFNAFYAWEYTQMAPSLQNARPGEGLASDSVGVSIGVGLNYGATMLTT